MKHTNLYDNLLTIKYSEGSGIRTLWCTHIYIQLTLTANMWNTNTEITNIVEEAMVTTPKLLERSGDFCEKQQEFIGNTCYGKSTLRLSITLQRDNPAPWRRNSRTRVRKRQKWQIHSATVLMFLSVFSVAVCSSNLPSYSLTNPVFLCSKTVYA